MPISSDTAQTGTPDSSFGSAQQVISIAQSQIGSYGPVNKFNTWYGMPGSEWCDEFVSWVFNQAQAIKSIGGKFALTTAHAAWFKANGRWSTSGPQAGDLVFFDFTGAHSMALISHVGIVTGVTGSGVQTIEGNTGNNQVATRTRSMSIIAGFGTPDIAGLGTTVNTENALNPLSAFTKTFGLLNSLFGKLVDANWWKRAGLVGLGLIIIALGIAFFNRKQLETQAKSTAKEALIGAML